MFTSDENGVYRAALLSEMRWLDHGFGSRRSTRWPGSYAQVKQIHSDLIRVATSEGCIGDGDALVSGTPGIWIGVRTADCVPLLFADEEHHAVAAVHAGWRGTAAEISRKTIEEMAREFGTRADRLHVAIGPCIGGCCYEVGPEVSAVLAPYLSGEMLARKVDLAEVNRKQLLDSGVDPARIEVSGQCTFCTDAEFESFRRDKEASGRMVAAVHIRRAC